jgi:hypothetical protein
MLEIRYFFVVSSRKRRKGRMGNLSDTVSDCRFTAAEAAE